MSEDKPQEYRKRLSVELGTSLFRTGEQMPMYDPQMEDMAGMMPGTPGVNFNPLQQQQQTGPGSVHGSDMSRGKGEARSLQLNNCNDGFAVVFT